MTTLTITSKGQVTLKKAVLERLGLRPGDKLELDYLPDGRAAIGAPRRSGKISDAFGIITVKPGTPPLSIDGMNEVIAQGWAKTGEHGL